MIYYDQGSVATEMSNEELRIGLYEALDKLGPNAQNANEKRPPARQWDDVKQSYTTNEVAINWNAPLVFLLAEALPNPVPAP